MNIGIDIDNTITEVQDELNKAIGETPGLVQNEGNAYDKASAKKQARICV